MGMTPRILTRDEITGDDIDYSSGAFKRYYRVENEIYYFAVHPEYYTEEDGLVPTGNMFIVLLHPGGFTTFNMYNDPSLDKWVLEDAHVAEFVNQNIINLVSESICHRNM